MDKKTAEKLKKVIKEKKESGELVTNRVLIEPNSEIEIIKKRLCQVFVEFATSKNLSIHELSEISRMDSVELNLILHFHIDKVSIDSLVLGLTNISTLSQRAREVLQRLMLCV